VPGSAQRVYDDVGLDADADGLAPVGIRVALAADARAAA
jgi:hypothetical protein